MLRLLGEFVEIYQFADVSMVYIVWSTIEHEGALKICPTLKQDSVLTNFISIGSWILTH